MPDFMARVELHGVKHDEQSYQDLHDGMEAKGFSRTIEGARGLYHLPPAEYAISGLFTAEQVRELAKSVADKICKDNGVLVSEYSNAVWRGLRPVK